MILIIVDRLTLKF